MTGEFCRLELDFLVLHLAYIDHKTGELEILISLLTKLILISFMQELCRIIYGFFLRLSDDPFRLFVCSIQVEILASFVVHF